MKEFYENWVEFMKDLAIHDPARFAWNMDHVEAYLSGAERPQLKGGQCTADNCHDGTGCSHTTASGYCACQSPAGPCSWVGLP